VLTAEDMTFESFANISVDMDEGGCCCCCFVVVVVVVVVVLMFQLYCLTLK